MVTDAEVPEEAADLSPMLRRVFFPPLPPRGAAAVERVGMSEDEGPAVSGSAD